MKDPYYAFLALILIFILTSCSSNVQESEIKHPKVFDIHRGVNISHWLSQSRRRGMERAEFFTEKDVEFIASVGYDQLRIPIDEEQMWNENGDKEPQALALLHDAIGWTFKHDLKVIVDLHI